MLAEKSGHAIHIDEPDLVVSLVQEVIDQARKRGSAVGNGSDGRFETVIRAGPKRGTRRRDRKGGITFGALS